MAPVANWEAGNRGAYNQGWAHRNGVEAGDQLPPLPPVDPFKLPPHEAQQILNSIGQHALKTPKGKPTTAPAKPAKSW
jgi:hypothetical protein